MPVGAVLLVEMPAVPSEDVLHDLRVRLLSDLNLGPDDFYADGPLQVVESREVGPRPVAGAEASCWVNVNLWKAFYSPDYPRGDIETIVACADWLESNCENARAWYGHDGDDENLAPFPAERRKELIRHGGSLHYE